MKGLYREEIVNMSLQEYPCRWCDLAQNCQKKCMNYRSARTIYNKIGKGVGKELLSYLRLCEKKSEAMEAVLQYNQY